MNFYSALRVAEKHYARRPASVPDDQPDPAAYRLACAENLALAMCQRAEALEEKGCDTVEAAGIALGEAIHLATQIAEPTPAHLADTAKQLFDEAEAEREEAEDIAAALATRSSSRPASAYSLDLVLA